MRIRNILSIVLLISVLFLNGCNAVENESTSGSKLILLSLTGTDLEGEDGVTTIFCDILYKGGPINTNGVASLTAQLLDPTIQEQEATYYQNILLDQIDVEYSRSDGQNVQGVDIPYHFSQKTSVLIEIGAEVDVPFILVNHDAKIEPPLIGLINQGQAKILKLEAKITIHGKDLAGNRIQPAVGHVSIWCADFPDEDE